MKDYPQRGTMDFLFDLFDIFNLFIEVLRNLGEYLSRN
jgi:hypothetical protein